MSAANIRALYQKMAGGGVDSSWISDLKELRKEMGLGDTLGVLPIENMQLKVSDEVSGLSAADGYAISPKGVYDFMNELLNREKSGARIYKDGSNSAVAMANGSALSASGSNIKVNVSGPYVVTIGHTDNKASSGDVTDASFLINDRSMVLGSMASSSSRMQGSSYMNLSAAGSAIVYLKKGDVLAAPSHDSSSESTHISISEQ